jgi:hypothetical protein
LSFLTNPTADLVGTALSAAVPSMNLLPYRFFAMKASSLTPAILSLLLEHAPLRTARSQQVVLDFVEQFQKRFRDFPKDSKLAVFQYCLQNVDSSPQSGMIADLLKVELKYLSSFGPSDPEMRALLAFAESLFQLPVVPLAACELLSQCCKRLREPGHAKAVFEAYLRQFSSYQSHSFTVKAGECVLSFNPGSHSVFDIVPIARRFFATWSAIVAVERSVHGMTHAAMQSLFWTGHEVALQLLDDPVMRPFAPVFALLDGDRPLPPELGEFVARARRALAERP